ncbi:MAG TPA: beta-N-acetylhexosaminidase [Chlamydiales bacterium]|nr:beta-N-acetylhexosaminidase [Chlamydiales bacterium]
MIILACLTCFMPLEEKVGQMMIVNFRGEIANDHAKVLIQEVGVGGIIYYNWANQLSSPEQVQNLSDSLQSLAKIPLLIAVDQEGGKVARLKDGFTLSPGNRAIAEQGDPNLAKDFAFIMGQEMKAVGINMNLAPVVDVNVNPKNPVIGDRSFSDSPEVVTIFGKAALDGYHQAGLITTLKHFPGHGDVEIDSHVDLPILHQSMHELEQVELFPFSNLAKDTDAIMTAHILVPALDVENCATFSKKILSYAREIIGFDGLIVADSLVMQGALKQCNTVEIAAIRAINAGCDLLLFGGKMLHEDQEKKELSPADIKHIHKFIVEAVKTGLISEERIDESVHRIMKLKNAQFLGHSSQDDSRL